MAIPPLSPDELARRVQGALPDIVLGEAALGRLWLYFEELRRWSGKVDLIGPGTAGEVPERHFAESLAALPWLPDGPSKLLDIGSGAGFPGLALAAARPDLEVTLVEPRERRRAFLAAVARRAKLAVQLLARRVDAQSIAELPAELGTITLRAIQLEPAAWPALASRLGRDGRVLVWCGASAPALAKPFAARRERLLPASRERLLREYRLEESR